MAARQKTPLTAAAATAAAAVFVRTPELSPVKTRLQAATNRQTARAAYKAAVAIVEATLQEAQALMPTLAVYWAVAEEEGATHKRWRRFPALWTGAGGVGDGGLGHRLANVYSALRRRHGRVVILASDSPQMAASAIARAAAARGKTAVGPAADGGFYLFASDRPIARRLWLQAPYSSPHTLRLLLRALGEARPLRLPKLADMDDKAGLMQTLQDLKQSAPQNAARLARAIKSGAGG